MLTAARSGAVRWAEWTEIDRDEGVWTLPARRTKANREHRVPLCGHAIEILDEARPLVEGTSPFLFPNRVGKQLEEKQLRRMFQEHAIAAVPHGFRSSFRDWAAEETDHPHEVIEAALAHVVQNKVEAAYRHYNELSGSGPSVHDARHFPPVDGDSPAIHARLNPTRPRGKKRRSCSPA